LRPELAFAADLGLGKQANFKRSIDKQVLLICRFEGIGQQRLPVAGPGSFRQQGEIGGLGRDLGLRFGARLRFRHWSAFGWPLP